MTAKSELAQLKRIWHRDTLIVIVIIVAVVLFSVAACLAQLQDARENPQHIPIRDGQEHIEVFSGGQGSAYLLEELANEFVSADNITVLEYKFTPGGAWDYTTITIVYIAE